MKKSLLAGLFLIMFSLAGFAEKFTVSIIPGKMWEKRAPQCAVWVCDGSGNYCGTLFVTKAASKNAWKFSPKDGRPESLPVWYGKSGADPAASGNSDFDAVTSATPRKSISVSQSLELESGKEYVVMAEVNQSFDYSDNFPKASTGVDGQPSVVYSAPFTAGSGEKELELSACGTGQMNGNGNFISAEGLEKITTAKEIVSRIIVLVR